MHSALHTAALFVAVCGLGLASAQSNEATEVTQRADGFSISPDGTLALRGVVSLPDGTPAADVDVALEAYIQGAPTHRTRTDDAGRFTFADIPPHSFHVQAATGDRELIAEAVFDDFRIRTLVGQPISLELKPSISLPVIVQSNGVPVAGALANAHGNLFDVVTTNADGAATIRVVADGRLPLASTYLSAFHPELGIGAELPVALGEPVKIELLKPATRTVRAVDAAGRPVAGVELELEVNLGKTNERRYFIGTSIGPSILQTGAGGDVVCPWFPASGVPYVSVDCRDAGWKLDSIDFDPESTDPILVHLSKLTPVKGRVLLPEGTDARGILVAMCGFGPGDYGHMPQTRCASDGEFTMWIAANHGYAQSILDMHWAADCQNGRIKLRAEDEAEEIEFQAYAGTPVEVVATKGPNRNPLEHCYVSIAGKQRFEWIDADNQRQGGVAALSLSSSGGGRQSFAVGRGEFEIRFATDGWWETKLITVESDEPVDVAFHRRWIGKREITAQLQLDGKPVDLSSGTIARAWSEERPFVGELFHGEGGEHGAVTFNLEALNLTVVVLDPQRRLFRQIKFDAEIDEQMAELLPAASFSGALTVGGQPAAGYEMRLVFTEEARHIVTQTDRTLTADVMTDEEGRFRFDTVPCDVPLAVLVREPNGEWERRKVQMCYFQPGEDRSDAEIVLTPAPLQLVQKTAEQKVDSLLRDSRLNHLPALFVLNGPNAPQAAALTRKLLDYEVFPDIFSFLAYSFTPQDVDNIAFGRRGWNKPGEGQLALVIAGPDGQIQGQVVFDCAGELVYENCTAFIREHLPEVHSGREKLAAACKEAAETNRKIWLIFGGSRCGPCILLGRWIDDNRELLERDFVIVTLVAPVDDDINEMVTELNETGRNSIPWFAILKPDGSKIVDSNGPLGNIGIPSSFEGIQHFRSMLRQGSSRMTDEELDELMQTLRQ